VPKLPAREDGKPMSDEEKKAYTTATAGLNDLSIDAIKVARQQITDLIPPAPKDSSSAKDASQKDNATGATGATMHATAPNSGQAKPDDGQPSPTITLRQINANNLHADSKYWGPKGGECSIKMSGSFWP